MPDETGNGLAMGMGLFAEALAKIANLRVIVVRLLGGPTQPTALLHRLRAVVDVVAPGPERTSQFAVLARIADPNGRLELFRHFGKPSLTGYLTENLHSRVTTLAGSTPFDVLHVGRAYLAPLAHLINAQRKTLDLDEADRASFALQAHALRAAGEQFRADWTELEGEALDRLVTRYGADFHRRTVASAREVELLGETHPDLDFDVVPNAVALPAPPRRQDDGHTLGFIGSFGFEPNVRAMMAFCQNVWPEIAARNPKARLTIAGRNPPADIMALNGVGRVQVLGEIIDLDGFYAATTLALAPLAAGGGTRIKLLEASAYLTPWVATPIGAAGIDWPEGVGGWIAASAEALAQACLVALDSPSERLLRAESGRAFVSAHYDRADVIDRAAMLW